MNSLVKDRKVVLLAFTDEQGLIMFNRRADASSEVWELIGGSAKQGETPLEAITREIREEVGYQLRTKKDQLRLTKEFLYECNKFSATVYCFTAIFPGIKHFRDSDEVFVKDLKMFSKKDARNLILLPMTKIFLQSQENHVRT